MVETQIDREMKDALLILSVVVGAVLLSTLLALVWWGCSDPVKKVVTTKYPECEVVGIEEDSDGSHMKLSTSALSETML